MQSDAGHSHRALQNSFTTFPAELFTVLQLYICIYILSEYNKEEQVLILEKIWACSPSIKNILRASVPLDTPNDAYKLRIFWRFRSVEVESYGEVER